MNKIKTTTICLLAAAMFSCNDDPQDFADKAYINQDSPKTNFLILTDVPGYSASLNVGIPKPAGQELGFTFKVDESLVAAYNGAFYDHAVVLPAEHYTFTEPRATIQAGGVTSTDIAIEFTDINLLDAQQVYVLPVTIAQADNVEVLPSARTHYYLFKKGYLINWGADIEENFLPVKWGKNSLVSSMHAITVEAMLYMYEADRPGSEFNIKSVFGIEGGFLIRLGDNFGPDQVQVCVGSAGNFPKNADERTSIPVGKWCHLAVTLDASGLLNIYLDGEHKSTSSAGPQTLNLTTDCFVGRSYNNNRWWPGMICETRVWNKARTQEEIAASMYRVAPTSEGLVAYWKFDEGSGNTIADHTGNGSPITANATLKWIGVELPK